MKHILYILIGLVPSSFLLAIIGFIVLIAVLFGDAYAFLFMIIVLVIPLAWCIGRDIVKHW